MRNFSEKDMKAKDYSPPVCRKGICDMAAACYHETRPADPRDLLFSVTKFKRTLTRLSLVLFFFRKVTECIIWSCSLLVIQNMLYFCALQVKSYHIE